jgi:mono/diheme cytochrome c family protein
MSRKLLIFAALAATGYCMTGDNARADELEAGKKVFEGLGACASCHGNLGKGDGPASAALNPKPRDLSIGDFKFDTDGDGKRGSEADLLNIVTNGAMKYGGSPLMAGRPDLPEADRKSVVKYVLSLHGK